MSEKKNAAQRTDDTKTSPPHTTPPHHHRPPPHPSPHHATTFHSPAPRTTHHPPRPTHHTALTNHQTPLTGHHTPHTTLPTPHTNHKTQHTTHYTPHTTPRHATMYRPTHTAITARSVARFWPAPSEFRRTIAVQARSEIDAQALRTEIAYQAWRWVLDQIRVWREAWQRSPPD